MTDLQQDMQKGAGTNDPKKAPANFEEDEDDVGDVEENLGGGPRGRPGPSGNQYRTATSENQNQAMQIDQRGAKGKRRASSQSTSKKGNQMANKSYASSEMGGDESHNGDPEFSKDFNSAYAKLVEKIYQEQGNTLLISQDEIYKLEHSVLISFQFKFQKQLNEENFRQRNQEFEDNKRRKLLEQQELTKDKDLDGCTFQPQLMTHHAVPDQKRNLDQFLQDQNKFLEKVQKKREDAKNQTAHEEVSVMQPSIDDYSRKIVEEKLSDRKNKTTYERLYDLNKEQQQKKLQKQQAIHENVRAATQHTVSNQRDKAELERSLYEDAEIRRRNLAKKKEELDKTRDQQKEKYYHNDTSDKYVAKRLERELQQLEQDMAVQEMAEEEHEDGGEPEQKKSKKNISFQQLTEILAHMGFVPNKPVLDSTDQQLCQDLWTLVKGEDREGVTWEILKVLFLNFIGLKTPEAEKEPSQEEASRAEDGDLPAEQPENKALTKLAFFEDDHFYLKKGSHSKVFGYFKNFYVNRVGFIGGMKKQTQSSHGPEFYQKPQISEKSARLAENKRKKLLGERENTSTVEIFLLPKHNEAQLEERRKQMKEREVEGCTFRPQTLKYQSTAQQQESAGFRGETLYQSRPKGWFVEKGAKTQDDVEFEKGNQDCTFRPSINDPSSLQALNDGSVGQVKGIDKQMERMNKARQNQLEKKLMTERGMPSQLMASIGRPEPVMNFSSNKNKFASGFGADGSQIRPPKRSNNFANSQRIDQRQLQQVRQSQPQPQAQQQTRPAQQQKPVKQATRKAAPQQQQYQQVQQQQIEEHHYEEEEQIHNVQVQQQQQMHRNNSKTGSNRQFQQQQQQEHQQQQQYEEVEGGHYSHHQEGEHLVEEHEESQQIEYAQEEEQYEEQEEEQYEVEHQVTHHVIRGGQQVNGQQQYVEEEETYQEEVREGMNETDYEGQQFQEQESSEQSPVKSQNDREPMLYVDVNLGNSGTQRIVVFEGDTAEGLAEKFGTEYQLDDGMKEKLTLMLQQQIAGVLEKIEEVQSNNSDNNIME